MEQACLIATSEQLVEAVAMKNEITVRTGVSSPKGYGGSSEEVREGPQEGFDGGILRAARVRIPFRQRPTCTIAEACDAVGLGRTKLYELIGGGALETITIGRRRLVRVPSLLRLVHSEEP